MTPRPGDDSVLRVIEGTRTINGRYDGVQRLGASATAGHFSLMFRAVDRTTKRPVALKFLHPEIRDPYRRRCFTRESELLADLRGQPNILQLVEPEQVLSFSVTTNTGIVLTNHFPYYAAELAHCSLHDYLYSGSTDPADLLLLFAAMCKGVQRLHVRRIAHRDLKPANCLLFSGRELKLSDFGTAKHCDSPSLLPRYDYAVGDRRYTALELLCGIEPTPDLLFAADLYSLGTILFEMFSLTLLYPLLFTAPLQVATSHIAAIDSTKRKAELGRLMTHIQGNWSPPSLRLIPSSTAPLCIVDRLDELYRSLVNPDFDRRARVTFDYIFRQLEICTKVIRNHPKWQALRRTRRVA